MACRICKHRGDFILLCPEHERRAPRYDHRLAMASVAAVRDDSALRKVILDIDAQELEG